MLVYLAGPIDHVPVNVARAWRQSAIDYFADRNIQCLSPMHRLNYPADQLVEEDLRDIERADVVLARMPRGIPFVGTSMEVFYAFRILRKPVIAWDVSSVASPWIKQMTTELHLLLDPALKATVRILER